MYAINMLTHAIVMIIIIVNTLRADWLYIIYNIYIYTLWGVRIKISIMSVLYMYMTSRYMIIV